MRKLTLLTLLLPLMLTACADRKQAALERCKQEPGGSRAACECMVHRVDESIAPKLKKIILTSMARDREDWGDLEEQMAKMNLTRDERAALADVINNMLRHCGTLPPIMR